jgi:hypothetical protein
MNASRTLTTHLLLAAAVAASTIAALVAVPHGAGASTPPRENNGFGGSVAIAVLPVRAIDVDLESTGTRSLRPVDCAGQAAAGTRCYVSAG